MDNKNHSYRCLANFFCSKIIHLAYINNKTKEKDKTKMLNVLNFFSEQIANQISQNNLAELEEIRIRVGKPIILKFSAKEKVLKYIPTQEEIIKTLQFLCDNSIYSYQSQICDRFYHNRRRS